MRACLTKKPRPVLGGVEEGRGYVRCSRIVGGIDYQSTALNRSVLDWFQSIFGTLTKQI